MNQITNKPLGSGVIMASSDEGFSVTPQTLSDIVEFAKFMCQSKAGIPDYLHGNAPDCAAIIMQSLKWGFDPFSVAQKSYKVKDVLAFEAQLIAAVVNARSGIKGRLKYVFDGSGADLTCTVTGVLDGEEYSYTSPPVGQITTKNSPLWKTDPRQQLGYYSARSWARRYTPEVLLGVYDREEAESFQGPSRAKDVTPSGPSMQERLMASRASSAGTATEGFSPDHIDRETGEIRDAEYETVDGAEDRQAQPSDEPGEDMDSPSDASPGDDTGESGGDPTWEPDRIAEPRTHEGLGLFRLLNEEGVNSLPADERETLCLLCDDLATDDLKAAVDARIKSYAATLNGLSVVGKRLARGAQQARIAQIDGEV